MQLKKGKLIAKQTMIKTAVKPEASFNVPIAVVCFVKKIYTLSGSRCTKSQGQLSVTAFR